MGLSYKKLWKKLIDIEINKKELAERSGLSQYTINKLNRNETVTTKTIEKICAALNCDVGDICEIMIEEIEVEI